MIKNWISNKIYLTQKKIAARSYSRILIELKRRTSYEKKWRDFSKSEQSRTNFFNMSFKHDSSSDLIKELSNRATIYGLDDRREIVDSCDNYFSFDIEEKAMGVAAVVYKKDISQFGEYSYKMKDYSNLASRSRQSSIPLCHSEKFLNQPSISRGTAFLVSDRLVVTSAHVVGKHDLERNDVSGLVFIFNFMVDRGGSYPNNKFKKKHVAFGSQLIDYEMNLGDWALIELSESVSRDLKPLTINTTYKYTVEKPVLSIGSPLGLPLKYLRGSCITKNVDQNLFKTNLDVFVYNSGSPIMNEDGEVIGLIDSGIGKFLNTEGDCRCFKPQVFPDCIQEGTSCQKIPERIFKHLK